MLYVKAYDSPAVARVREAEDGEADADYVPVFGGGPTVAGGLPILKPPYQTVTAIDLSSGDHVWRVPFGDDSEIRDHPALAGLDLPPMGGQPNSHGSTAGPLVTGGGLVFLAGGEERLYALDAATGAELWSGHLEGGIGRANPMTYRTGTGRQIVVVATSAPGMRDSKLVAFALPR
jgi:quinoprotein glucose dehydrogenase